MKCKVVRLLASCFAALLCATAGLAAEKVMQVPGSGVPWQLSMTYNYGAYEPGDPDVIIDPQGNTVAPTTVNYSIAESGVTTASYPACGLDQLANVSSGIQPCRVNGGTSLAGLVVTSFSDLTGKKVSWMLQAQPGQFFTSLVVRVPNGSVNLRVNDALQTAVIPNGSTADLLSYIGTRASKVEVIASFRRPYATAVWWDSWGLARDWWDGDGSGLLIQAATAALPGPPSATKVWNAGTGAWNVDGNWTPSGVPSAADVVEIASGSVTVGGGDVYGTLKLLGGEITGASWALAGTVYAEGGSIRVAQLDLGAASRIFDVAGTLELSGTLTAGGLVKSGIGNLTLSGANTFAGGTAVNDGTLTLAHANALAGGNLTVGLNGALASGTADSVAVNALTVSDKLLVFKGAANLTLDTQSIAGGLDWTIATSPAASLTLLQPQIGYWNGVTLHVCGGGKLVKRFPVSWLRIDNADVCEIGTFDGNIVLGWDYPDPAAVSAYRIGSGGGGDIWGRCYVGNTGTNVLGTSAPGGWNNTRDWMNSQGGAGTLYLTSDSGLFNNVYNLISSDFGITKIGAGQLFIGSGGANAAEPSYRGVTTVRNGMLAIAGDDFGKMNDPAYTNPFNGHTGYAGQGGSLGYSDFSQAIQLGDAGTQPGDVIQMFCWEWGTYWVGHDIDVKATPASLVRIGVWAWGGKGMFAGKIKLEREMSIFANDASTPFGTQVFVTNTISGAAGVAVDGYGEVILSGANTYLGTTRIQYGTLTLDGSLASTNITVGSEATCKLRGSGSLRPVMLGNVIVNNGTMDLSNLTLDLGGLPAQSTGVVLSGLGSNPFKAIANVPKGRVATYDHGSVVLSPVGTLIFVQ